MKLYIKTFTGETITLDLEPNDFLPSVAMRIQDSEGCPPGSYTLIMVGKTLIPQFCLIHGSVEDYGARALEEHGITDGSTLHMVSRLRGGGCPQCEAASEPVAVVHLVMRLCPDSGVPFDQEPSPHWPCPADVTPMVVTIRTFTGSDPNLKMHPLSTVADLMFAIEDRHGMPPAQQRMIFAGKQLENNRQLSDYGIMPHSFDRPAEAMLCDDLNRIAEQARDELEAE